MSNSNISKIESKNLFPNHSSQRESSKYNTFGFAISIITSKPAFNEGGSRVSLKRFKIEEIDIGQNGKVSYTVPKAFASLFKKITRNTKIQLPEFTIPLLEQPEKKIIEQFNYKQAYTQLGRSYYYSESQITWKKRKYGEDDLAMEREARMQHFLNEKKEEWGLQSAIPQPIYWDENVLFYKTPSGYHNYLTDIEDDLQFTFSIQKCAHDLGVLLSKGIAYPELISIFHAIEETSDKGAEKRLYTCFPGFLGYRARRVNEEGALQYFPAEGGYSMTKFPGEIEQVCDPEHHLFPDLGEDGLRDLGDYITIEDFVKQTNDAQFITEHFSERDLKRLETCTPAIAMAHFLSLYQLIFILIIAKREQKKEIWEETSISSFFCKASCTLVAAFLQLGCTESKSLLQDIKELFEPQKFTNQMRFCFTKADRSKIWPHEKTIRNDMNYKVSLDGDDFNQDPATLPTEQTVQEIWGNYATWKLSYSRIFDCLNTNDYSPEEGFYKGRMGNDTAANPLVEGFMAIFDITFFALNKFFKIPE